MTIDEIKQALREMKERCANIQTCKECPFTVNRLCFASFTTIKTDIKGIAFETEAAYPSKWCIDWPEADPIDKANATEPLTMNDYQRMARRTAGIKLKSDKMEEALFGLAGEVGELCDHYKKHKHQGHELNYDHMAEEAGDVLWYLAEIADALGLTLEDIARRNIDKLLKRYPDGFDQERSINREE